MSLDDNPATSVPSPARSCVETPLGKPTAAVHRIAPKTTPTSSTEKWSLCTSHRLRTRQNSFTLCDTHYLLKPSCLRLQNPPPKIGQSVVPSAFIVHLRIRPLTRLLNQPLHQHPFDR